MNLHLYLAHYQLFIQKVSHQQNQLVKFLKEEMFKENLIHLHDSFGDLVSHYKEVNWTVIILEKMNELQQLENLLMKSRGHHQEI